MKTLKLETKKYKQILKTASTYNIIVHYTFIYTYET
jgi:hypothetical protein